MEACDPHIGCGQPSERTEMLELADKDLEAAIVNMVKDLRKSY